MIDGFVSIRILRLRYGIHFVNSATSLTMTMQLGVAKSQGLKARSCFSNRHRPNFFFHLNSVDHCDGVPRAAVKKAAVRPFAQALLAADAEDGIDGDAAEWWIILVGPPEHAVFDRTVFHAGGRAGASGAALGDDRQFFGLFLARGGKAFGFRFPLELVGNHSDRFSRSGCRRHMRRIIPQKLLAS